MTSSLLLSGDFNFLYALRALRSYLFHGTLERPWAICSQLAGISHSHSSQLKMAEKWASSFDAFNTINNSASSGTPSRPESLPVVTFSRAGVL